MRMPRNTIISTKPNQPRLPVHRRPRPDEQQLDVEDDEEDGDGRELDGEAPLGQRDRVLAALEGLHLDRRVAPGRDERRECRAARPPRARPPRRPSGSGRSPWSPALDAALAERRLRPGAWRDRRSGRAAPPRRGRSPRARPASRELGELLRAVVARDRQVLGRRAEVLAEREDVDVGGAQVAASCRAARHALRPGRG